MHRKKILVIGDAMLDEYWSGSVSKISPVAPVPVVSMVNAETRPGAAANVAANIEAMGVSVERIFGCGERIRKITVSVGVQHIARLDFDYPQKPIVPDSNFIEAVDRCDMVVALDYGKGSLANIQELIQASKGKPFLIDPKGHDYARYRGAMLLKPNREEMRELVGGWSTRQEQDFKVRQFLHTSGIESILLTQEADGMTLYNPEPLHLDSENKSPVDVSGAGEAVISAFAVALAKGCSQNESVRFASRAAGLAIAKPGTAVLTEEQVFGTD